MAAGEVRGIGIGGGFSLTKKEIEIRIDREDEEIEFGGRREDQFSDDLRRRERERQT